MIKLGLANVKAAAVILGNPQDSFKSIHIAGTNGKGSVCTWLELMFLSSGLVLKLPITTFALQTFNAIFSMPPSFDSGVSSSACSLTDESTPLPRTRKPCSRQFQNKSEDSNNENQVTMTIGKYISPHLISVTERISINGKDISEENFASLWTELYGGSYDTNAYQSEIQDPQARLYGQSLTEFEKLTILAFEHFKRANVDLALIEVGLGGRLDATNILSPEHTLATAITNIGLDHQDYLGNTIEEIAREKRGIMKPSVPHYEGMLTAQAPNDIQGSNYLLAKQIYEAITDSSLRAEGEAIPSAKLGDRFASLAMTSHAPTGLAMTDRFYQRYKARFDESQAGMIIDGAHNPDGAKELNRYLRNKYLSVPKTWIIGMLDKDHESFLDNLFYKLLNPELDQIKFTRVNNSRSKDPKELQEYILTIYPNIRVLNLENLEQALGHREEHSDEAIPQEITIITGSLYLCGEYLSIRNK